MLQTPIHMCFALALVFLYNPTDKNYQKKLRKKCEAEKRTATDKEKNKYAWTHWFDFVIYAAIVFVAIYTIQNIERLASYDMAVHKPITMDYIALFCVVILLLEAVRRTLGYILFFFIIAFIIYSWVSPFLPQGVLRTVATAKNKTFPKMLEKFTEGMIMAEQGVYGTPLQTSCTSLFYFILFGAFFSECGGGQLLIDVGMKFSNKSSGGPAKAAVISSGLMGMVSGSAVANVATTGVMTIPMMKKIGYAPEEAGAIEAVASTGGQIMPPSWASPRKRLPDQERNIIMEFKLAHIGVNTNSPEEAAELAQTLCGLFNLTPKHGNKSEFAGSIVECMKAPFLGKNGHIALKTEDLEAAVAELKAKGYTFNMDTAAYNENGKLKNVYLDGEFGGFAIHIMQQ